MGVLVNTVSEPKTRGTARLSRTAVALTAAKEGRLSAGGGYRKIVQPTCTHSEPLTPNARTYAPCGTSFARQIRIPAFEEEEEGRTRMHRRIHRKGGILLHLSFLQSRTGSGGRTLPRRTSRPS